MPKIYRAMRKTDDDKPLVEASAKGLGVRELPGSDIDLDATGNVLMNGKGMSVAPSWRDLPIFRVPKRLKAKFPGARGAENTFCFTMGEGPFADGLLALGLDLKKDNPTHGNVVPQQLVLLDRFQSDLANTRESWVIDED